MRASRPAQISSQPLQPLKGLPLALRTVVRSLHSSSAGSTTKRSWRSVVLNFGLLCFKDCDESFQNEETHCLRFKDWANAATLADHIDAVIFKINCWEEDVEERRQQQIQKARKEFLRAEEEHLARNDI